MAEIKFTNLSISAFWHKDDDVVPLHGNVGLDRIDDNIEDKSFVRFTIHPDALEFLGKMSHGYVETRFDALPLDNPFAGKPFVTLKEIRPVRVTIEQPIPYNLPAKEMYFTVKASCIVEWHVFQEFIPGFQGDWRW